MSSASSPTKTASSASSVPSCSSKTTNTSSSTATCRSRAWQRSQRQPSRRLSRYRLHPRPPENAARWPQPNLHHIDGHDQICRAPASVLAGHVQRHLLAPSAPVAPMDDSLAVLSVRDALTECEAAAAIVQRWLTEDQTLAASEIGIILPSGPE